MPNDALKYRGYAQVFKPQAGQLGLLIQQAQRQKQFDDEMAFKKQQADQDWFDKNLKLGFADVRTELQTGLVDNYNASTQSMFQMYKDAMRRGGITPETKMAIQSVKNNYDTQMQLTKSLNSDLDKIDAAYKADPELYDKSYVSTRMKGLMDQAWNPNDGSFNRLAANELTTILDDPKALNVVTMSKRVQKGLGEVQQKYTQDNGTYWLDNVDEYTANVYQTEEKTGDGGKKVRVPKLDPDTGLPIPNASPEAIRFWDSQGPQYEKKLTDLANQDGISRKEAFDKYVVKNLDRKSESTRHEKSQWEVYGPASRGSNKDFNFQVSAGNFGNLKNAEDIGADGMMGTTSKSIDMQGLIDEKMVFKGNNNEDLQGKFMGFYTDENGNDAIGIQPYNNTLKQYDEETRLIPLSEKNRTTVRNTITDPKLRAVFDKGLKEYMSTGKQPVVADETKLGQAVTKIQSLFDGRSDSDIAESVRKSLLEYGISDVKVEADKKVLPGGWNEITIEGQDFDVDDPQDQTKLRNLLLNKAKNQFSKEFKPEDFDSQWSKLKSGESMVGPDGKTYKKQ